MSKGIIYVCSTAVNGLVKIGRTTDFESRMRNLEENGYRNVAGLKRQFAIEVENHEDIEALLGDLFSKSRVGTTEMYSLELNKVIQLLSSLKGTQIYPKNESQQEVFEKATEAIQNKLIPNGEYYLTRKIKEINKTIKAKMKVQDEKFILLSGSYIAPQRNIKTPSWIEIRNKMKLADNDTLLEDIECSAPSMAAALVVGRAANGWTSWKNIEGQYIDIYRKREIEEE